MASRSGRGGMGARPYRRNRATVLAKSDLCWLCGHAGAKTADHLISHKRWPRDASGRLLPGFDAIENLAPAHGTMGRYVLNRCPVCRKLCNQSRGDKDYTPDRNNSREW